MATSSDVLVQELNKVNKKDLINILVFKKVPPNVTISKVLCDFFKKLSVSAVSEKIDDDCFYDSSEVINSECDKVKCIKLPIENEAFRNEIKLQRSMILHLERRINDQEVIIDLLKTNCNKKNNSNVINCSWPTSNEITGNTTCDNVQADKAKTTTIVKNIESESNNIYLHQTKEISSTLPLPKRQMSQKYNTPTQQIPTQTLKHNPDVNRSSSSNASTPSNVSSRINQFQQRRKTVIGSNNNTTLKAISKLGYLHVYRLDSKTTSEDLQNYLQQTAPKIKFSCELLKKTDKAVSYIVSFPLEHVKEVYDPKLWPCGACVRRYIFRKHSPETKKNFLNVDPPICQT